MTSRRREIILCVCTCSWNFFLLYCSASDRLTSNSSISDGRGETLVSAGERFQLGFFTPNGSSSSSRYVGIWYYNFNPQTIVWVANRDAPISDRSGVFAIKEDGNLEVLDGKGKMYWSTNLQPPFDSERAKLLDSGNLILGSDGLNSTSWESFHNPTDTFLLGMKMDETLKLISWKSPNDSSTGDFIFQKYDGVGQFLTLKRSVRYWRNGQTGNYLNSDQMPSSIANLLLNSSMSDNSLNYTTRLVMKYNGELQSLIWDSKKGWSLNWWEPRDPCSVFDTCGKFGSCNGNNGLSLCKCLPGFEPSLQVNWNSGDYSGGCTRISPIQCGEGGKDTFLSLKMMQVRNPGTEFQAANENECRRECLSRCDCQAYSYDVERNYIGRGSSNSTAVCWIWTDDLSNLMEECAYGAPSLYARVAVSDIAPTSRTCAPCGTYMIPYPLSTGPNCGDPLYFSFNCNVSTAQVNFKALSGTYRVTSINLATQNFSIQAKDADNCEATSSAGKLVQLNQSLPFHVNKWCNTDQGNFSSDMLAESKAKIEIGWDPPLEPTCTTSTDCNGWPNSTCKMAKYGNKRCLCKANFQWSSSGLKCTHEEPSRRKVVIFAATSATAIAVTAFLCIIFFICYRRRRRVAKRHGDGENIQRNQVLHLYDSTQRVKSLIDSNEFSEDDKIGIDVPFFDLESILAATDNFSDANKLGEGGFGTVYKGKFQDGQLMAVKRLTSFSGQGLGEFKNEVVLIAKLQHRNLVTLLGYCVEGEEKILLYEYMPNKSLDAFLVDRTLCVLLNWESRFNIILGIARGLLYLHQDSKLRIIHRDLKTSNILLDEEMTPKISDFGLARIFEGKQTESSTNRVIGTFGYMAPEYALDGYFSDKSDVFSFGVVVLEIISGKKNTGFYQTQQSTSLLNFAWNLWNEDKALDLMDKTLRETCTTSELLKCIHIGLLCVQEDPSDRPTMSNVVVMLGSGTATLPIPKQPTFMMRKWSSNTTPESTTTRNMLTTEEVR